MATITTQDIQDIAVSCVTDFFNNGISLNEGLAKQASFRGLNADQLQRAVEATNTLTHLKNIGSNSDRTSEFPVADFKEIVKVAFVPDLSQVEASSEADSELSDLLDSGVEKMASFMGPTNSLPKMSVREVEFHLRKMAHANSRALEDAKSEYYIQSSSLTKLASVLKADLELREHLSASTASDLEFIKVAGLYGITEGRADYVQGMFKSAELDTVEQFLSTLRKCASLKTEIEHRTELEKQAWGWLASIGRGAWGGTKKVWGAGKSAYGATKDGVVSAARAHTANVNSLGLRKGTAQSTSQLFDKSLSKVESLGSTAAKKLTTTGAGANVGILNRTGSAAGRLTGAAIDRTAGAAARTLGKGVKATASAVGTKIQNTVANTSVGQAMKLPTKPISSSTKARWATAAAVGGLAMDVGFAQPRVSPENDRSGSVMEALRG